MFANEGLYTTLSWSQIAIGLIIGFAGLYLSAATDRLRRKYANGVLQPSHREEEPPSSGHPETPHLIVGIVQAAYYALRTLANSGGPISQSAVVQRVQTLQKKHGEKSLITPLAVHTAIQRMLAQRHIRIGKRGFEITDSGKELLNRLARVKEAVMEPEERSA